MLRTSSGSPRSVVHAMFCIERTYPVARALVFKALTDPKAKAKWFTGGNGYTLLAREMDADQEVPCGNPARCRMLAK